MGKTFKSEVKKCYYGKKTVAHRFLLMKKQHRGTFFSILTEKSIEKFSWLKINCYFCPVYPINWTCRRWVIGKAMKT